MTFTLRRRRKVKGYYLLFRIAATKLLQANDRPNNNLGLLITSTTNNLDKLLFLFGFSFYDELDELDA